MTDNTRDKCQFPKCSEQSDLVYIDKGLCDKHWEIIAKMDKYKAYKKLKIKEQLLSSDKHYAEIIKINDE